MRPFRNPTMCSAPPQSAGMDRMHCGPYSDLGPAETQPRTILGVLNALLSDLELDGESVEQREALCDQVRPAEAADAAT